VRSGGRGEFVLVHKSHASKSAQFAALQWVRTVERERQVDRIAAQDAIDEWLSFWRVS
jgi:hypothetical protein